MTGHESYLAALRGAVDVLETAYARMDGQDQMGFVQHDYAVGCLRSVVRELERVREVTDMSMLRWMASMEPALAETRAEWRRHFTPARLRAARRAIGWTQAEAVKRIGSGKTSVGRWERGDAVPGPWYRRRIIEVYGSAARTEAEDMDD